MENAAAVPWTLSPMPSISARQKIKRTPHGGERPCARFQHATRRQTHAACFVGRQVLPTSFGRLNMCPTLLNSNLQTGRLVVPAWDRRVWIQKTMPAAVNRAGQIYRGSNGPNRRRSVLIRATTWLAAGRGVFALAGTRTRRGRTRRTPGHAFARARVRSAHSATANGYVAGISAEGRLRENGWRRRRE